MDPPNILLLHWHDVGRHLGTYGVPGVSSPNIDRLAAQGVRFDQAFSAAPQCSPARGAIFTGRYPHANGLMGHAHLGWSYHPGERRLPELLRPAGYHSVLVGMQHESVDPVTLGYDEVLASGDPTEVETYCGPVTDAALAWLDGQGRWRQPFLLVVGFTETHRPYPWDRYTPDDPSRVAVPAYLPDNAWVRDDLAAFQGAIRSADFQAGRLLERLDTLGLAETTWIIFTTDHGIPFPRAKATLYDPGIEVALIMRPPAAWPRPQGAADRLVSHVDLVPTILDRVGLAIPPTLHGVSHARWLLGDRAAPRRREIYVEKTFGEAYDPMRAVRTSRWKYIRSYEPRSWLVLPHDVETSPARIGFGDDHLRPRPMEELYDLAEDPLESTNLADAPACTEVRVDLAGRLLRWRQRTADPLLRGPVPRRPWPRLPRYGALSPHEDYRG